MAYQSQHVGPQLSLEAFTEFNPKECNYWKDNTGSDYIEFPVYVLVCKDKRALALSQGR
jgi:hypothetical protein